MKAQKCLRRDHPARLATVTDVEDKERRIEDPPIIRDSSQCATRGAFRFTSTTVRQNLSLISRQGQPWLLGLHTVLHQEGCKEYLQKLLDMSFIGHNFCSRWGAPAIFGKMKPFRMCTDYPELIKVIIKNCLPRLCIDGRPRGECSWNGISNAIRPLRLCTPWPLS